MPCSIVATPGSALANAYCSIADADLYHEAHVAGATWAAYTSDQKCRALQQATRQLDAYVRWGGFAASQSQALAWPRYGLIDPRTDLVIASTVIPALLVSACCEQARLLLDSDRALESDAEKDGIASLKVGSVAIDFTKNTGDAKQTLAPSAWAFVAQWGVLARQPGQGGTIMLGRV